MPSERRYDVIFLGGGLANGLAAYRLSQTHPQCRFVLIESGPTLGGHHTWSFHGSDVDGSWVEPFAEHTWDGHDVLFPHLVRTLGGAYHSLRSEHFHALVKKALGDRAILGTRINQVYEDQVFLSDGRVLLGNTIIDGRGAEADDEPKGFQKFLGQYVTLKHDHGMVRPTIMDARVDQLDGFRFVYLLPTGPRSLLIEDTYYSDTPQIDEETLRQRLQGYLAGRGWQIESVDDEETGVLPIPLWHQRPRPRRFEQGHTVPSGMRAGLFHPTTGYSFAAAVRFADCLAACVDPGAKATRDRLQAHLNAHQHTSRFYRRLNNMMFLAAAGDQRRTIMQQFYRRSEGLIFRFYKQRLSRLDCLRMLSGRPPVPLKAGLVTFFTEAEA